MPNTPAPSIAAIHNARRILVHPPLASRARSAQVGLQTYDGILPDRIISKPH